jgi:hypothetical protein
MLLRRLDPAAAVGAHKATPRIGPFTDGRWMLSEGFPMANDTIWAVRPLADIYRSGARYAQVYLDMSVDTGDPPPVATERRKGVIDRLRKLGAPQNDIDVIVDVMATEGRMPSPRCLFLLVRNGEVVIDEWIPGLPPEPEHIGYGPVPDLTPLLKSQPASLTYLVVEAYRGGGELRLYKAGSEGTQAEESVEGRTDMLHKTRAGGWSNDRWQDHTEEIWRKNQAELALSVDDIVRSHRPRLLIIAGDIRARQLLEGELSKDSLDILAEVPPETEGQEALENRIEHELARVMAEEKLEILDRLRMHEGRGDNLVELTFGGVVQALAGAQVDTIILDSDAPHNRTALALDAEPWIATAPEQALTASVIDEVDAQLALARAALLTDARILFTDSITVPNAEDAVTLPDGASVAALLRWPVGPAVPGAAS